MPEIDGFEATQLIRNKELQLKNGEHIPIVALTADVEYGTRELCLHVGMDDFLPKPVKKSAIEEILQNLASKFKKSGEYLASPSTPHIFLNAVVLVVEDNMVNAKIASVVLKKNNFQVEFAENAKMALDMVTADHQKYKLILMDIYMPGITDGRVATKRIRAWEESQKFPQVPIIALTGDTSDGHRELCLKAGCNEFMSKPIDYPLLVTLSKKFVSDYMLRIQKTEKP